MSINHALLINPLTMDTLTKTVNKHTSLVVDQPACHKIYFIVTIVSYLYFSISESILKYLVFNSCQQYHLLYKETLHYQAFALFKLYLGGFARLIFDGFKFSMVHNNIKRNQILKLYIHTTRKK